MPSFGQIERELKKAQKKAIKRIKGKNKPLVHRTHTKRAKRNYRRKLRDEETKRKSEALEKGNLKLFREQVKKAKDVKNKRKKYRGNEEVGFHGKYIKRDDKIKRAEKRQKVRYGGSNYWYV